MTSTKKRAQAACETDGGHRWRPAPALTREERAWVERWTSPATASAPAYEASVEVCTSCRSRRRVSRPVAEAIEEDEDEEVAR